VTEHGPDAVGRVIPLRAPAQPGSSRAGTTQAADAPPADLQIDLATAQQVIADLEARQVNLHFEVDHTTGTVRVEVLDGTGQVLREIPARSLLDTLSGGGILIDRQA
jgi:uncharacterized FlaG/YvyC family protein